jgi:NAD(P)-dependent dehydrogenase (short-subunit alcohol dehydrogenase family)
MKSAYWDENLASRLSKFQYEFPENSLAGRTIVLAGGAGGLGAATAMLLAREGARLVVGYRTNRTRAEALSAAIQKNFRTSIELVAGDLAAAESRKAYLQAVDRAGAPLSGAAIFPGDPARATLESVERDDFARSFETNFIGPILLARDLGQLMEKGNGGSIVLLATMQALGVFPSSLNYAAPKAALVHAAQILAQQWQHVRVNVVAPGATVAGMAEASVSAGKYDRFIQNGSISRFGRPEDVARAVRFFLEPDNYMTGQVLLVDGGLTLRRDRG